MSDFTELAYQKAEQEANRLGAYMALGQKEPEKLKNDIQKHQKVMRGVIHEQSRENAKKLVWVKQAKSPTEMRLRAREVGIR